ncbi:MAG: helix-turn-helix domain-containing protein [Candidatus Omnitrophica bacterium]|nr:helix-turn-helix domain-containing protein [Candidatus Omnitrophota bacterium]
MMRANHQRTIQILDLIEQEPDAWTNGKLGKRFGVSRQTIFRYIQALRKSGYDIQSPTRCGYRLIPQKKCKLL